MVSSKVILALALVCVALVPAYAVDKCHVCQSPNEGTTTQNINCIYGNTTSSSCGGTTGQFTHCIKEVKDEGETNEQVIKKCGNETNYPCTSGYDCYYCDENDCNSAVTISNSVPVIGLTVVAAYLLSRFNH